MNHLCCSEESTHFDSDLRDLEARLVLGGENHAGSRLPALCEKTCADRIRTRFTSFNTSVILNLLNPTGSKVKGDVIGVKSTVSCRRIGQHVLRATLIIPTLHVARLQT